MGRQRCEHAQLGGPGHTAERPDACCREARFAMLNLHRRHSWFHVERETRSALAHRGGMVPRGTSSRACVLHPLACVPRGTLKNTVRPVPRESCAAHRALFGNQRAGTATLVGPVASIILPSPEESVGEGRQARAAPTWRTGCHEGSAHVSIRVCTLAPEATQPSRYNRIGITT
jgi:hypothetical protein